MMKPMHVRAAPLALLLAAVTFATACSGSKSTSAPPPQGATSAASATATATGLRTSDLSLVYVDTSKGQGGEVYVSAFDGSGPRKVTTLANGTRAEDVRGNLLVASAQRQLSVVDLKTGAVRTAQSPNLISGGGRFVDDATFVFTTLSGCGPPNDSNATVAKLNTTTLQLTELAKPNARTMNIAGLDAALGQVAITLRGCDVGVRDIAIYSLADGRLVSTIVTMGCGQAGVSLATKKALVAWRLCTQPPEHAGSDFTLIDLAPATPAARDIKVGSGEANLHEFKIRPRQAHAALGAQSLATPGPGFKPVSTGLFLVDLTSGGFTSLAPADGAEQYPVGWSPDGRYLLAGTVRAQGLCDHTYIDTTTREVKPIAKDVTYCGANGEVIGWTALK
jgi:hypothetical protein